MKRILTTFLVLNMVFITVMSVSAEKKITIWCSDKEVAGLEPVAKKFKKKKRITVNVEVQAEVRSKFISAAIAKTGPDIVVGANDWVGELAKNGVISEVNLSSKDKQRFFPSAVEGFTYNNKMYGIPYAVEALVLIYNKRLIKSVPSTWEEVLTTAKKMTKPNGNYGFLYGLDNDFYPNFPFIGSQGGYIFKKNGNKFDITDVGLDNPGAIEGAKFINKLVTEGVIPESTNKGIMSQCFLDGKVAMIMDGPWNMRNYKENIGAENLGVVKLPTLKGKKSVPFVSLRGFMINNASKNINNAKEFVISFATTKEAQIAMYKAGGRPPAEKSACEYAMSEDNTIKAVIESVNDGIPMPNMKAMAVVWNYAAGMVDRFKTGETTVENAVKNAVKTIREDISVKNKNGKLE